MIFSLIPDKSSSQILPSVIAKSLPSDLNESQINFKTYENSTLGIKVQYPSDWIRMQNDTVYGTSINFFSIASGKISSTLGSFGIDITHTNGQQSLKDYIYSYSYALKKYHPNVKVDSLNFTNFANYPAYKMIFTDDKGFKLDQIWVEKNNTLYHIIYPIAHFISVPIMQKIINSFQIID